MKAGQKFNSTHFKGIVTIDIIDSAKNELKVTIKTSPTNWWEETWNLEHTKTGFERGEYTWVQLQDKQNESKFMNGAEGFDCSQLI